jgi:acetolactate synthase-1/2/3 large subunit
MRNGMPNFSAISQAYGIEGYQVNNFEDLDELISAKISNNEGFLVDVNVIENENCYPMVAPGRSNSQMLGLQKATS